MNDGTIAELVGAVRTLVAGMRELREGMSTPPRWALTRKEAAKALGVSLSTLKRYISTGLILVAQGDPRLIPLSEIRRFSEPKKAKSHGAQKHRAAARARSEADEIRKLR